MRASAAGMRSARRSCAVDVERRNRLRARRRTAAPQQSPRRRAWSFRRARCRRVASSITRRLMPRARRRAAMQRRCARRLRTVRVSKNAVVGDVVAELAPGLRPATRSAGARAARSSSGRAGRGRPRTCWRSPPAAPARCRCSRSPSRGGCAARASAARAGSACSPCASTVTPTRRPGIWRLNSSRVARYAACGPPKPIGTPKRCALPTTTSAPHSPGGVEQRQRQQVGRDDHQRALAACMRFGECAVVAHVAVQRPDIAAARRSSRARRSVRAAIADHHLDAERLGARAHDVDGLRQARRRRRRTRSLLALPTRWQQRHRLGGGGGFVEHRRIGDRHAGQVGDHRSGNSAALPDAPARSPADTACRRCTTPGSRARCAG